MLWGKANIVFELLVSSKETRLCRSGDQINVGNTTTAGGDRNRRPVPKLHARVINLANYCRLHILDLRTFESLAESMKLHMRVGGCRDSIPINAN